MAWHEAVINLAAVALGGIIAALANRGASRRDARAKALTALQTVSVLRLRPPQDAGVPPRREMTEARAALLAGGASWVSVELHERATLAAMHATWYLGQAARRGDSAEAKYASRSLHPSRFTSRPIVQWAEILDLVVANEIERPLRARLLRPLVSRRLHRVLAEVRSNNEATLYPGKDDVVASALRRVDTYLQWPSERLRLLGIKPFEISTWDV